VAASRDRAPTGGGQRSHGVASPTPATATAAGAATVAAVEPELDSDAAAPPDLERIKALWSGVADAVREQNGMVAALIAEAVPATLEGHRLTVAFPADAAFSKRKAEANRELVVAALRSLTGAALTVVFELSDADRDGPPVAARALGEEELLERLRRDFAAEEVLPDAEPASVTAEAASDDSSPDTED